ncbi:E3 ubiquitin/ISG15 ligase TRIM25 isoform X2 [Xenopus laevis]|uniref:E3 ubiquitin/ISG15 ligase TRIM25 isoform X2 n=1 Tax=Xenopus laevis TaxID=8355 RepID=A0A8J0TRT6_XENLA|nr:E3 ubiquitin/ISG15 ligase TRIM25 isoform X2 [Xenopus laevis]
MGYMIQTQDSMDRFQFQFCFCLCSVMRYSGLRDNLTCSVCCKIYTEPVTLPCGHNFCLVCIVRTWEEQRNIEEDPSCPLCRQTYRRSPKLKRNQMLSKIVQKFIFTQPEHSGPRDFCTYCLHSAVPSAVPATKSCLHCATSMCEDHVTQHSQSPEHELTEPAARCSAHQELLRFLCTEDGAPVCVSCCLAGEHRGHKVELLNEASEIRNIQDKLSCSVCCKIYTEPVTLPCGHNFCLVCIERTWEEHKNMGEYPFCPECGVRCMREKELRKNNTLCNIVPLLVPPPEHDPFCVPKHSKSAEHVSSEPSASPGLTHCSAHRELPRYLCTEDGAPVCLSCCLAGDHRGHKVQMFHEEQ